MSYRKDPYKKLEESWDGYKKNIKSLNIFLEKIYYDGFLKNCFENSEKISSYPEHYLVEEDPIWSQLFILPQAYEVLPLDNLFQSIAPPEFPIPQEEPALRLEQQEYPEWYLKLDQEEQQELIQCFIRICETIYAASLTDYYTITKQFQEESFILIYEITDKRLFKNQLLYIIYRIRHYKDGAIPYSIIFGYFQDHPDFGYRGKNNFLQILEIELNNKDQFLKVCRAKQNHIQGSAMPMMILCQKLLDKWNK